MWPARAVAGVALALVAAIAIFMTGFASGRAYERDEVYRIICEAVNVMEWRDGQCRP